MPQGDRAVTAIAKHLEAVDEIIELNRKQKEDRT